MICRNARRAFTLIEVTMVLMVIGVVTALIWAGADRVWTNYRIYRLNQQIIQVTQNVRDYYGNSIQTWATPGYTDGLDITGVLDALLPNADIFPSEMRRDPTAAPGTTPIDHAFNNSHAGGSFHILAVKNVVTTKLDAFRLELQGLSAAACTQLLMSAPLNSDSIGFVQVTTLTTAGVVIKAFSINKGVSATAGVTLPLNLTAANAYCASAGEVDFDMALHN